MKPPAHAVAVELEVPFHHVDAVQIAWHGRYYEYMGLARTALFRQRGLDVADVVELGYAMVVVESRCRHNFPLRYGDRFRVKAWCAGIDHKIHIRYEVWNVTHDRRSARASTTLATVDHAGNLQLEIPDAIASPLLA